MAISITHKCIFVHVPKTGGTTIENHLGMTGKVRDLDMRIQYNGINAAWRHLPAITLREIYPEIYESYYKFSFVRNPYDRVVSEYLWKKGREARINKIPRVKIISGFSKWMKRLYETQSTDKNCTQYKFLHDDSGNLLVNDVFVFEKFEDELQRLFKKLNVSPTEHIHANKSRYDIDKSLLLTEENKEFIYAKFKIDFETFNYPKDYVYSPK